MVNYCGWGLGNYTKDGSTCICWTRWVSRFLKSPIFNDPRVLCVNNEYILLSGKINANEYAVLLSLSGDIMCSCR